MCRIDSELVKTKLSPGMKNYPSAADIAEMKARCYDPSAMEKLEDDQKRGERAEALCRQIEEAFAGVTPETGSA